MCDTSAFCVNTEGSYNCTCLSGSAGSGFTCEGIFMVMSYVFAPTVVCC